ncbi:MAG: AAA family ATPase, partial [Desulfofustis sp.]|nr:AAA family ATPase [Desulfofustis sp.]
MQTNRQPFHDTIDTAIFYGGGSRREIVDDIKAAFADEAELLTLAGTDGSGKTMICRVVELELQRSAEILFFEQGAESFDEVVNRIAAHVELEESDQISDRNDRLEKSVEILHQQDRRLILILDGAEKIFLATLERIRRMLDQVNGSRVSIQLLISGRPLFSLNYKQLAIINFKVVKEQHFSLDPLDGKATHLYLNHCLDQSDTEEQKRFSLSQAEEIADIARGNFKLINQLARKLLDLKRLASEKGEAVEDEYHDGADLPGASSRLTTGLANVDLDFLKVPKIGLRWYAVGGGIVVLVLLIALLRGGGEEDTAGTLPGAENVPDLTLEKVEPDPIEIPEPSRPVEPLQPPSPGVAPEELQPAVAEDLPPDTVPEPTEQTQEPLVEAARETQTETTLETSPKETETIVQQGPPPQSTPDSENVNGRTDSQIVEAVRSVEEKEETLRTEEPVVETSEERGVAEIGPVEENVIKAPLSAPVEGPAEINEKSTATQNLVKQSGEFETQPLDDSVTVPKLSVLPKKIPTTESTPASVVTFKQESKLRPDQPAAPTVDTSPPRPPVGVEPETKKILPESPPEQVASIDRSDEEVVASPLVRPTAPVQVKDSSVYYAQRLAAGSRWLVGGSREKYTVQLMVL